jgi:Redoxin
MSGIAKKIETTANVAIIVAAVVFTIVAVRHFRGGSNQPIPHIPVGAKFGLQGVNWQDNNKNLVLGLSTGCHFCTESAPFYRELVQYCKQEHVRTVAVFPQDNAAAEAYLKNEGVQVDEIRQAHLTDIGINGTPTLLLINDAGVVKDVWEGKLPGKSEKEVLAAAKR